MRLYITVWDEGKPIKCVTFTGTQEEQRKAEKQIRDDGNEVIASEPVDMPDDKAGRIHWLNNYQVPGINHDEPAG
jgi:hypothetical protein